MLFKFYRFGITLAAGLVVLAGFSGSGQRIEGLLLHLGGWLVSERAQESDVVVIAIDDKSIADHGAWPWSRERLAGIVDRLAQFQPKTMGLLLPLSASETADGIATLKNDIESLDPALQKTATQWLAQLDTDSRLAGSLQAAGNVVLSASYRSGRHPRETSTALNEFELQRIHEAVPWHQAALNLLQSTMILGKTDITAPLPLLLGKAAGLGLSPVYTRGQWVHGQSLVVDTGGRYLPGFELSLWAAANDRDVTSVNVSPGAPLKTGADESIGALDLGFYPYPANAPAVYSLSEILRSDVQARALRGKTLLLGLTATELAPLLSGPSGKTFTPVTWSAQVVAGMLTGNSFSMPTWFYAVQRLLVLFIAICLILIPAAWHGPRGLLAAFALAALLVNVALVTLIVRNIWLPVITPVLFLCGVQLLLTLAWHRKQGLLCARRALLETRTELASQLQSQGQLDQAMEQYLKCLPEPSVLQPVYELGLEYERRRQVGKAQMIYRKLVDCAPAFRDAGQRCNRLAELSDRFPGAASSSPDATRVLDAPVLERPVLGRYQVERELGQGAMGTVYLATDPTIGREVAIKTLPLLQEYEGAEQAAVAERFFQEAEAVGRLDHPNIVTVYDAGKEHDLAYIAMDYVAGDSLDHYTAKADLLPVWEVLEIAAQVAEALDYAHRRSVVHRDIKPGNIMYDREGGAAKITDFGIARLLDTSRTRTGTILGSPSYMSPEQVAGKKTDGRSDFFSLGVTLFQLLTGQLPFTGDSVATLMYQIASKKTPAVRKLRSGLPISVSRLINKALQKSPSSRFQSGAAMAEALRKCRAQFRGGRRKTA